MKLKPMTGIVAAAVLAAAGAYAEDKETVLSDVVSPVLINQGESYVEAHEGMLLQPGDQLMVMQGGSAQINLAVGCTALLQPNSITRITSDMSCDSFAAAGTSQAIDEDKAGGGECDDDNSTEDESDDCAAVPPSTSGNTWSGGEIAGAVFTGAVVVGAIDAMDSSSRDRQSVDLTD